MPPGSKRPPTPLPTRSSLYVEDDDEKTPITNDPFVSLEDRSRRTHAKAKEALEMISVVAARQEHFDKKLTHVAEKLDEYIQIDQQEHKHLNDGQQKTAGGLRTISAQVAALDKQQTVNGTVLSLIHEDVRSMKRVEEHRTKVTIETDAVVKQTHEQDLADSRRVRRERGLKILGIIGGAVGSGGIITAIIMALLGKC